MRVIFLDRSIIKTVHIKAIINWLCRAAHLILALENVVTVELCSFKSTLFKTISCILLFDLGYYFSYVRVVFIQIHNAVPMNVIINKLKQKLF